MIVDNNNPIGSKRLIARALKDLWGDRSNVDQRALELFSSLAEIYVHLQSDQPKTHFCCYDSARKIGISLNEEQCSVDTRKQGPQHLTLEDLVCNPQLDKAELPERISIARRLLANDPTKHVACLNKKIIFFFIPLSRHPDEDMDFYNFNPELLFETTDFNIRFRAASDGDLDAMRERRRKDLDLSALRKLAERFVASVSINSGIYFTSEELYHMYRERAFYAPEIHICFGDCREQSYEFLHSSEDGEHNYSFVDLQNGYLERKEEPLHLLNFKPNNQSFTRRGDDIIRLRSLIVYYTNPSQRGSVSTKNFFACQALRRKLIEILQAEQPIEALKTN